MKIRIGKSILLMLTILTLLVAFFVGGKTVSAATKEVEITVQDFYSPSGKIDSCIMYPDPCVRGTPQWRSGNTQKFTISYDPRGSAVRIPVVICWHNWWGGGGVRELAFGRWVDKNTPSHWYLQHKHFILRTTHGFLIGGFMAREKSKSIEKVLILLLGLLFISQIAQFIYFNNAILSEEEKIYDSIYRLRKEIQDAK